MQSTNEIRIAWNFTDFNVSPVSVSDTRVLPIFSNLAASSVFALIDCRDFVAVDWV